MFSSINPSLRPAVTPPISRPLADKPSQQRPQEQASTRSTPRQGRENITAVIHGLNPDEFQYQVGTHQPGENNHDGEESSDTFFGSNGEPIQAGRPVPGTALRPSIDLSFSDQPAVQNQEKTPNKFQTGVVRTVNNEQEPEEVIGERHADPKAEDLKDDGREVESSGDAESSTRTDTTNGPFLGGRNIPRVAILDIFPGGVVPDETHGLEVRNRIEQIYGEDGEAIEIDELQLNRTENNLRDVVKRADQFGDYDAVNLSYIPLVVGSDSYDRSGVSSNIIFARQLHNKLFGDTVKEYDPDKFTDEQRKLMAETIISYATGKMGEDHELYDFFKSWDKYGDLTAMGHELEAGRELMSRGTEIFAGAGNIPINANLMGLLSGFTDLPGKIHIVAATPSDSPYYSIGDDYQQNSQKIERGNPIRKDDPRIEDDQSEHLVTDVASSHDEDDPSAAYSSYATPVALATFLRKKAEDAGVAPATRTKDEAREANPDLGKEDSELKPVASMTPESHEKLTRAEIVSHIRRQRRLGWS